MRVTSRHRDHVLALRAFATDAAFEQAKSL
jgi:hypothetical protein